MTANRFGDITPINPTTKARSDSLPPLPLPEYIYKAMTGDATTARATGGSIDRDVADILADSINPLFYINEALHSDILNGTSSTDVATALQTAIDEAESTGKTLRSPVAARYVIGSELTAGDIHIEGLRLRPNDAFRALHVSGGGAVATTTLSADARAGANTITVTSATGIQAGQILTLVSDRLWDYDPRGSALLGELQLVRSVSGSTITLDGALCSDYDTDTDTATVSVYDPISVDLANVEVIYPTKRDVNAIRVGLAAFPLIKNLSVQGAYGSGLNISSCFGAEVAHSKMVDNWKTGGSTGYGIQVNQSTLTSILGGRFVGNRRGVDVSGTFPSRHTKVIGAFGVGLLDENTGSVFGTHGPADHTSFIGCTAIGGANSFLIRGSNTTISDCDMHHPQGGYVGWSGGPGLKLLGNRAHLISHPTNGVGATNTGSKMFLDIGSIEGESTDLWPLPNMPLVIHSNTANVLEGFIRAQSDVTEIKYADIRNNTCAIRNNSSGGATYGIKADAASLSVPYGCWGPDAVRIYDYVGTYSEFSGTVTRAAPTLPTGFAPITENGALVGGTNDGDLPDLSGTPTAENLAAAVRELASRLNALGES